MEGEAKLVAGADQGNDQHGQVERKRNAAAPLRHLAAQGELQVTCERLQ